MPSHFDKAQSRQVPQLEIEVAVDQKVKAGSTIMAWYTEV